MSELVKSISSGLLKTLPGPIATRYQLDVNEVTVFLTELINKQFTVEVPKVTEASVASTVSDINKQRVQNGYIMFSMDNRGNVIKELADRFKDGSMSNIEKLKIIQARLRDKWSKLSNDEKVRWIKIAEQYNLSIKEREVSKVVEPVPYILSQSNMKPVNKVVANTVTVKPIAVVKPVTVTKPVVTTPNLFSRSSVSNPPQVKSLITQKPVSNVSVPKPVVQVKPAVNKPEMKEEVSAEDGTETVSSFSD